VHLELEVSCLDRSYCVAVIIAAVDQGLFRREGGGQDYPVDVAEGPALMKTLAPTCGTYLRTSCS